MRRHNLDLDYVVGKLGKLGKPLKGKVLTDTALAKALHMRCYKNERCVGGPKILGKSFSLV